MAGDCDFLLRVVAADLDSYRRFQAEQLARIEGVRSLKTFLRRLHSAPRPEDAPFPSCPGLSPAPGCRRVRRPR